MRHIYAIFFTITCGSVKASKVISYKELDQDLHKHASLLIMVSHDQHSMLQFSSMIGKSHYIANVNDLHVYFFTFDI